MNRIRTLALSVALACTAGTLAAEPAATPDARISVDVRAAIFHRAEFAGDEISVQTRDGVVYLHGLVDTNVERAAVEDVAKATPGVKRVVNTIELRNRIR
jgi:osmotically-inducible protein OsmY